MKIDDLPISDRMKKAMKCAAKELSAPCPVPHKTPKEVLEGMRSCPNLQAFAEAQKKSDEKRRK